MKKKYEQLLPILRSSLPPFERMLPYLEKVEGNRCHSNFGPMFKLFEERMADFFNIPSSQLVMLCNGTLALVTGLMAMNIPQGKYCLMPSWTFSATPASALLAGLKPFFLDVNIQSQTLTADAVLHFLSQGNVAAKDVGAVIAVSPFGAPINRKEWDDFTLKTNIPVMIDAAASFDAVKNVPAMGIGSSPIMISLHATKIFGIGEGGMLVSTNTDLIHRVKGISNFGFDVSRASSFLGMNAKMSEYQAAIGLAVLDSWEEIRLKRLAVTNNYINMFQRLGFQHWLSPEWLTSNCNALIPGKAEAIRDHLISNNIESRIWWGKGCHSFPAYDSLPTEKLPNTTYLSGTMLGLPSSIDTAKTDIDNIGDCIHSYLEAEKHKPAPGLQKNYAT
jgi:dTDP-4-amino-4,6-dideoxygalactose transaminase